MQVRFFNGGYGRQLLAMVDRRTWRFPRIYAVFFALRHPSEGWVLVDSGYGGDFFKATRGWPYWVYRCVIPVTPAGPVRESLRRAQIDSAEIRHVIVTHFHSDHIGGLAEFPHATIHYREDALAPLQALSPIAQCQAAFLPKLVPTWLPRQSRIIPRAAFATSSMPFATFDLFSDGLIDLIDLPGHAPGHLGLRFTSEGRNFLYATDAFWETAQIKEGIDPWNFALNFEWRPEEYKRTIRQLRVLAAQGTYEIVSCHAQKTQALIS